MYFIRVSWKYIANVETEAEGGREEGERGVGVARPRLLCSMSSLWDHFLFVQQAAPAS